MTERQRRGGLVCTIGFGLAMLAGGQAFAQSSLGKRPDANAGNAINFGGAHAPALDKANAKAKIDLAAKVRNWHVGDPFPDDGFGGGLTLEKNFRTDRPRAKASDDPPTDANVPQGFRKLVLEIKGGQRPGGVSKQAYARRERAIDELKAMGPAAIDAVPALSWSAMHDADAPVRQGAIEILGDIGGVLGIVSLSEAILQKDTEPRFQQAAEDALVKLLGTDGGRLTMNDAIFLLRVHDSGRPQVAVAVENAWASSGVSAEDIAKELKRRFPPPAAAASAKKNDVPHSKIQALCVEVLHADKDPQASKAAEDELSTLIPAAGTRLTPRDAFFLYDVRKSGNARLSAMIQAAWDAAGFSAYFAAAEKLDREQPGHEEAEAKAYAATHGGKQKPNIRDLPEAWQRWMMTPDRPPPDFAYWFARTPSGDGLTNEERHQAEIDRQNREAAANRAR